jgi:hypothetical protein
MKKSYLFDSFAIRKIFYVFMAFAISMVTMSNSACGGTDDDDDDVSNITNDNMIGKVTVEFERATTRTLYAYKSKWSPGHSEVHGTVLDYLKNGATFIACLSKDSPSEVTKIGNDYIYSLYVTWQFDTSDEVKQGAEITIYKSNWDDNSFDNAGYFSHDCTGIVLVKSIKDNRITLQFENFKFDRISNFKVGSSTFQDLTVNGEITFELEKY